MPDPKKIKFIRHTRNYRKGQVVDYDPTLEWYVTAGAAETISPKPAAAKPAKAAKKTTRANSTST